MDFKENELGKLIGAAKRVWTTHKTERISTDKIERQESALFSNDYQLAELAHQKTLLDQEIINHIDQKLEESRGFNRADLSAARKRETQKTIRQAIFYLNNTLNQFNPDEELGREAELAKATVKELIMGLNKIMEDYQ